MGRKDKTARNIGGQLPDELPDISSARDSVLLIERLLLGVLKTTIDRLSNKDDPQAVEDLTRFFSHFYDPTISESERNDLIANFQAIPPKAVIGYPRSTASFPCFSIILEGEQESENFLGDFAGETTRDEGGDFMEYVGAFYESTYGIYIYAEHPDVCIYLYQFAKSVVHGAKPFLFSCGVQHLQLSGGELVPDAEFMPESMFVRILRVTAGAPMTVPAFTGADPRKVRITGIWRPDVVVDGIPSGVTEVTPEELGDGANTIED